MYNVHDLLTDLIRKTRKKPARSYNKKEQPLTKPYDIGNKVQLSTVNMLPTKAKKIYPL